MKKNSKRNKKLKELKNNINSFIKFYTYSFIIFFILIEILDAYKYKDNIYYHDELRITDEQLEELEEEVSKTIGKKITEEDNTIVLGAVLNNKHLTEKEKEIIYECDDLLEDNPYLIKSAAYNNLEKLDIKYNEDADFGKEVLGVYIQGDNEITIIKDNSENDTIHHELVHCIYSQHYYETLPKFFNEGMTELLTNEYFADNPFLEEKSYPFEITMIKMLCELVGEDIVLETYSKEDISILENAIKEKTNLSNPHEFIEYIDSVMTSLEEYKTIDEDKLSSIINVFDIYYENYDKESIEYKMYKQNTTIMKFLKSSVPYSAYEYELMLNGYYVKPYFNKDLKDKYPIPFHVEYYQDLESKNDIKKYSKQKEKRSV